jgi:hypothetical protein
LFIELLKMLNDTLTPLKHFKEYKLCTRKGDRGDETIDIQIHFEKCTLRDCERPENLDQREKNHLLALADAMPVLHPPLPPCILGDDSLRMSQLKVGSSADIPLDIGDLDLSQLTASLTTPSGREEPCLLKMLRDGHVGECNPRQPRCKGGGEIHDQ